MSLVRTDIEAVVAKYSNELSAKHRFTSFDYCYNYFRTTPDLREDLEKSCLVLGFYLASWGMFRGSSFLLQNSLKALESTIQYIAGLPESTWQIDVDSYTDANMQTILDTYQGVRHHLVPPENAPRTLTTKVLLGVFGFIPAFDSYFTTAFKQMFAGECGFSTVNSDSLKCVAKFYEANRLTIDQLSSSSFTTDFLTGEKTTINYPKAKIIDMYGFSLREKISANVNATVAVD